MSILRFVFLGLIGLILIVLAFANLGNVTINLLPDDVAELVSFNFSASVPIFAVILISIIIGILIGFALEWLREYKYRSDASKLRRQNKRLSHKVASLKVRNAKNEGDEVLALIEK